jgi:hypothetical protein
MYCHHCEGEIQSVVVVQNKATPQYFCCDPCAYVYVRKIYEPEMRDTVFQLKQFSEKMRFNLDRDEFCFQELNKKGITTFQQAISLRHLEKVQPELNSFETFQEHVDYKRLELRMCVLLAKTIELLLERKPKVYVLFKKKVMEAWEELIAQSPNDIQSVNTSKLISYFYDKLKSHEPAYGIV